MYSGTCNQLCCIEMIIKNRLIEGILFLGCEMSGYVLSLEIDLAVYFDQLLRIPYENSFMYMWITYCNFMSEIKIDVLMCLSNSRFFRKE